MLDTSRHAPYQVTLAAPILAACGQAAAPAAPVKPAESKPAEAKAAEAKPAAPAAPAAASKPAQVAGKGDKQVVLWSGQLIFDDQNTAMGKWATWVRESFADKNPQYTLRVEDHGWDQPLRTGLLTAIAGGTVPEVTTGEAFVHEFATLGAFLPVPDLSEKDFVYGSIAGSLYNGKLYGAPIYTSAFALETNVRVAQKAGLDPNKPPKTWAELIENSEKAFKAGSGSFVGYNLYGPAPNRVYGTVLRTIPWINQTGKPLGDDEGTKATFNAPEQVAAYEFSRKLFATADPGNSFSGDEGKLYSYNWQDKAVYQISQMGFVQGAKDAGAEIVYHPIPRKDPNVSGNVVLGNIVFSPLAKSKNPEGAVAFVKYMADKETQKGIGEILGNRLPPRLDLLKDPALEKLAGYQRLNPVAARTYADILLNEDVRPVPPYAKNPDKIWIAWGDTFGKIPQSSDPIQPTLDQLQQEVERLLYFVLFTWVPILVMAAISLTEWNIVQWPPKFVGLENYLDIFTAPYYHRVIRVTVTFGLIVLALEMGVGFGIALLLNEQIRARAIYRTIWYLPVVISGAVLAQTLAVFLYPGKFGALNSLLDLVGVPPVLWTRHDFWTPFWVVMFGFWRGVGSVVIFFLAGLQSIDPALYEAAQVDGANRWHLFRRITIPLIAPVTVFVFMTSLVRSLQMWEAPLVLTFGGPNNTTRTMVYSMYSDAFGNLTMGLAAAEAMVLLVVLMAISGLNLRILGVNR